MIGSILVVNPRPTTAEMAARAPRARPLPNVRRCSASVDRTAVRGDRTLATAAPWRRRPMSTRRTASVTSYTFNRMRGWRSASAVDEPIRMTRQEVAVASRTWSLEGRRDGIRRSRASARGRRLVQAGAAAAIDRGWRTAFDAAALKADRVCSTSPMRTPEERQDASTSVTRCSDRCGALVPLRLRAVARGRGGTPASDARDRTRRHVDQLSLRGARRACALLTGDLRDRTAPPTIPIPSCPYLARAGIVDAGSVRCRRSDPRRPSTGVDCGGERKGLAMALSMWDCASGVSTATRRRSRHRTSRTSSTCSTPSSTLR